MSHRVALALFVVGSSASWATAQVPAGAEFRVNSFTTGYQYLSGSAAVGSDSAGNFVVSWTSIGQDGSAHGVFAQRYAAAGSPRGGEFQVNSHAASFQYGPSVALDVSGNFVVAWASWGQDGDGSGVHAQRYDRAGVARGAEFQVNSHTAGDQRVGSVASDATGNFVVLWRSYQQDGSGWGVFAQRYDASGTDRGTEFRVNTYTTGGQEAPTLAADAAGNLVVVWESNGQDGSESGLFGQRYNSAGVRLGSEFQVNSHTTYNQWYPSVSSDPAGNFVVVWGSYAQDGSGFGVFGQRYDASGTRRGGEFQVNTYTTGHQYEPFVASDSSGNFVVVWGSRYGQDGSAGGIFAQRYDAGGTPRGVAFQVNSHTTNYQYQPAVASDAAGNFVAAWSSYSQDGDAGGVFAQRFGGLLPAALAVDPSASSGSDGNGVLEPGETVVDVKPSWRNANGAAQTFAAGASSFTGPAASGVSYELLDAVGAYGTVANGATATCSDCYQVGVTLGGTRPATHWDATFTERLTPDAMGQTKPWTLHVGESFTDVPTTSGFYRFVETLLHKGVTGGCSATSYCPASTVTRQQLSVFVLAGKEGAGYGPVACGTPVFWDVPASSPFCRWIEELSRRGVVSGCGGGNYCPGSPVTRQQMPVFVLKTLDPTLDPPACGTPMFADVPASSPFCRWIEELARRGVVSGCGGGNYCPTNPVNRQQMGVFISLTFGLTLYGD